jgi:long-chain acyl-CoA synthetase
VDPDGGLLPRGEVGELAIGGDHVMGGYWQNREATVKTLDAGWLRTGDMARMDERGYVYVVDRKADVIISGGYNIMPREIERVLAEDPDVAEVAVVGLPDPDWGEAVTAFVVPREPAALDRNRLLGLCAQQLAGFKKPKRIEVVAELPKGTTGKILRGALKQTARESPR